MQEHLRKTLYDMQDVMCALSQDISLALTSVKKCGTVPDPRMTLIEGHIKGLENVADALRQQLNEQDAELNRPICNCVIEDCVHDL